ncbi:MAG: hypothetical protein ACRDNZ_19825 [Streptosporangiaceae bacterium]
MLNVEARAAAQTVNADEESCYASGERQEEDPQACFDLQDLAQGSYRSVADSEPVAFARGKIFARLPRIQVTEAAGWLVTSGQVGIRASQ